VNSLEKILIKGISELGNKTLKMMYDTTKKETIKEKISIRLTGYKAITISENPYVIEITFRDKFMNSPVFNNLLYTFIAELEKQICKENIAKDKDYTIEVI
jgi:hypothetical protein